MTQKNSSFSGIKFIVKETNSKCSQGQIFKSLSGSEFHKSDLRFLNVLEDPLPLKLFEKLLELDNHVSSLGYHIVELNQLKKGVQSMPKPVRTHFSYNGRIHMMYCENIPMRNCLILAQILDGMSFDDIYRLSRVIMRISNGFFPESALKAAVNEKIGKNQVKKYRSDSHEQIQRH